MQDEEITKKLSQVDSDKIYKIDNKHVVRRTLMSLIYVATTKTSDDYAWTSIKKLMNELKSTYDFLKYIEIKDIKELRYTIEDINIESNLNNIEPRELGKAIQDIIDLLKKYLGKKAGYFFIQEFREVLGEEYHKIIKSMGVDLRLVELQDELYGVDTGKYKIKDDSNSNIAYVEKID
jgi:hypothetical protein